MCSRNDTEHLQPEPAPEPEPECWLTGTEHSCEDRGCLAERAEAWPARRRAQLDERAAQVLGGALEDHRRAGL